MASFCPNCGNPIKPHWKVCSQCGSELEQDQEDAQPRYTPPPSQSINVPQQPTYSQQRPTYQQSTPQTSYGTRPYGNNYKGNTNGTISICCAFLGLFIPFVGLVLGIIAIIFGAIGINKDYSSGISIAGIIIGILAVIVGIFYVVLLSVLFYNPWTLFYY